MEGGDLTNQERKSSNLIGQSEVDNQQQSGKYKKYLFFCVIILFVTVVLAIKLSL